MLGTDVTPIDLARTSRSRMDITARDQRDKIICVTTVPRRQCYDTDDRALSTLDGGPSWGLLNDGQGGAQGMNQPTVLVEPRLQPDTSCQDIQIQIAIRIAGEDGSLSDGEEIHTTWLTPGTAAVAGLSKSLQDKRLQVLQQAQDREFEEALRRWHLGGPNGPTVQPIRPPRMSPSDPEWPPGATKCTKFVRFDIDVPRMTVPGDAILAWIDEDHELKIGTGARDALWLLWTGHTDASSQHAHIIRTRTQTLAIGDTVFAGSARASGDSAGLLAATHAPAIISITPLGLLLPSPASPHTLSVTALAAERYAKKVERFFGTVRNYYYSVPEPADQTKRGQAIAAAYLKMTEHYEEELWASIYAELDIDSAQMYGSVLKNELKSIAESTNCLNVFADYLESEPTKRDANTFGNLAIILKRNGAIPEPTLAWVKTNIVDKASWSHRQKEQVRATNAGIGRQQAAANARAKSGGIA